MFLNHCALSLYDFIMGGLLDAESYRNVSFFACFEAKRLQSIVGRAQVLNDQFSNLKRYLAPDNRAQKVEHSTVYPMVLWTNEVSV